MERRHTEGTYVNEENLNALREYCGSSREGACEILAANHTRQNPNHNPPEAIVGRELSASSDSPQPWIRP